MIDEFEFTPDERAIFRFRDRKGPRAVDPLNVYDEFLEAIGDESPEDLFRSLSNAAVTVADADVARMVAQEAREARRKLVAGISRAFGVQTLADDPEHGLADADLVRLYTSMVAFLLRLKKNTEATPSSLPPSESPAGSATPVSSA